jgi:hypothetical protein
MLKSKSLPVLAGAAAVLLLPLVTGSGAQATTFDFTVTGGPPGPGCSEACSATAAITPGTGTLTVALTDTEANPRSAGDLLSSIEITPSGSVGTPSLSSQAGSLITVTSTTGPYTTSSGPPTHWGVGVDTDASDCETGTSCIALETAGNFAVGGKPINMIIGPPDAMGNYSNANGSITTAGFSPFIDGTGTFVIADSDITSATTIAGVKFDFGTSPDTFLPGVPVPAPLIGHGLFVLLAVGGVLFGAKLLERSKKLGSLKTASPHAA